MLMLDQTPPISTPTCGRNHRNGRALWTETGGRFPPKSEGGFRRNMQPEIAASLGHVQYISWVVVAYLVANTIAAPVYGRLGDLFGRRKLMLGALVVFSVASVLCALAPRMELLVMARLLQGLGGGGLMTLTQALVGETVPPRERARFQGYLAAVAVSANALGPVIGGYLTQHFGWQSIFLVNIPLGAIAFLLV